MTRSARALASLALALGALPGPVRAQTGLVPLTELGTGTYHGFPGGLYPGGSNHPPIAHMQAALAKANSIVPRLGSGAPDPQGVIAMIAVGMSNTTHEFAVFERAEDASRARNVRVVLLDTGLGGQTAAILANPAAGYWSTLTQRLSAMGLTPAQVQVAWLKEADAGPPDNFPVHAQTLRDELELVANNLHDLLPNLVLCYVSSRIYGGYSAPGTLNPEPQAYESGFSVKWLIEDQIGGDPGLNDGRFPGPVRAPLLLWGPYLWADGPAPRADGLVWLDGDFEADHVHPSPAGEAKVAGLLSTFFTSEASAASWWPATAGDGRVVVDALKDAYVSAASPSTNFGAGAQLVAQGGGSPQSIYIGFDLTSPPGSLPASLAKLSLRVVQTGGGRVAGVPDTSWEETTLTFANAPAPGAMLVNHPQASRDGTFAANVTAAVTADPDRRVTFLLSTTATGGTSYHSREAGQPPRLVLTVPCAGAPDSDGDAAADPCDCAPADAAAMAIPREVTGLRWVGAATLAWDPQAASAGTGIRYDVLRGELSAASLAAGAPAHLCLASDVGASQTLDTTPRPAPGAGGFYLVRARTFCGTSRWETGSDGRDRPAAVCP